MKKTLLFSALLLSACGQETVSIDEYNRVKGQVDTLNARLQQLENNQSQLRGKVEEAASVRVMPKGSEKAPKNNSEEQPIIASDHPQPPASDYQKGIEALQNSQPEEAVKLLNRFLSHSPKGEQALFSQYWLGEAYFAQENHEMAMRYFAEFLKYAPNHEYSPNALQHLVEALQALGKHSEAQSIIENGVKALK